MNPKDFLPTRNQVILIILIVFVLLFLDLMQISASPNLRDRLEYNFDTVNANSG